jgi:hypothetical protein
VQTRAALDAYIKLASKKIGDFLFAGRRHRDRGMTMRQYPRLVATWVASIGLDAKLLGTHSLCPTKATLIYRRLAISGP